MVVDSRRVLDALGRVAAGCCAAGLAFVARSGCSSSGGCSSRSGGGGGCSSSGGVGGGGGGGGGTGGYGGVRVGVSGGGVRVGMSPPAPQPQLLRLALRVYMNTVRGPGWC